MLCFADKWCVDVAINQKEKGTAVTHNHPEHKRWNNLVKVGEAHIISIYFCEEKRGVSGAGWHWRVYQGKVDADVE